jgi:hypothetical protein
MEDLKYKVTYYKEVSCEAYKKWRRAKEVENALRREWEEFKDLYEKYDRQLAEVDGRKTFYPISVKKTTTVKKDITLTRDQVLDLASKLGIVLNLDEDKEDGEELDFES